MFKLIDYLANLDSAEDGWGVWVNPDNYDDFRIGKLQYINGGVFDDKIFIGRLSMLSFGDQDYSELNDYNLPDEFHDAVISLRYQWAFDGAYQFVTEQLPDIFNTSVIY